MSYNKISSIILFLFYLPFQEDISSIQVGTEINSVETRALLPTINFTLCYSLNSLVFVWDDVPNAVGYEVLYNDGSGYVHTVTDSEVLIDETLVDLCYGEAFSITVTALDANSNVICSGTTTCNFACPTASNITFNFTPNQNLFCLDITGINESQLNISVVALGNNGVPLFQTDCGESATWTLNNGDMPISSSLTTASFELSNLPSGTYTVSYQLNIPNCSQVYGGSYFFDVVQLPITPFVSETICLGQTIDLRDLLIFNNPFPDSINFYLSGVPPNLDPANIIDPPIVSPSANTFYPVELFYDGCAEPAYTLIQINPVAIQSNTFIGNGIQWTNPNNWSLGIIPDYCQNVIIPSGKNVVLLNTEWGKCNTLIVDNNSTFIIPPGAIFESIATY